MHIRKLMCSAHGDTYKHAYEGSPISIWHQRLIEPLRQVTIIASVKISLESNSFGFRVETLLGSKSPLFQNFRFSKLKG